MFESVSIVHSDNEPCFTAAIFNSFSKDWGFGHVTSSARYPQSDGLVERAEGTRYVA